ncbi:MAG: Gfo/Idh/MocA family protein [Thermomicrobiales bacterium]
MMSIKGESPALARVRVGVVGTGGWAQGAHLPGFAGFADAEVVAVAGLDRVEAERAAAEFAVPAVHASAAGMIAAGGLDAVAIVTPDDQHAGIARAALSAGLHVLCEKPLGVTVAEAGTLADAAAGAKVRTKMGFTMRHAPAMRRLRELVAGGEIGEPRTLQAFQQNGQFLDPATPFHWKMDGARTGGGAIVEYGVHTLDLARWIMGEATRVCATSRTQTPARAIAGGGAAPVTVDDSTSWLMDFAGGATGMCHAGWSTVGRGPGVELRVYGSRGALRCLLSDDLPGAEGLWFADAAGQRFEPVEIPARLGVGVDPALPWWRRFSALLIRDFLDDIILDRPGFCTFVDGLRAQELLAAVIASAREGRWVDVDGAAPLTSASD